MDDLSLFNTDFFDYDVFANDSNIIKQEGSIDDFLQSIVHLLEQQPQPQQPQQSSLVIVPRLEEKKKRNTQASARFRVKKKQREQEMELKIKQLNEDISKFNNEIRRLEIENKILKNLVFDKNGDKSSTDISSSTRDYLQSSKNNIEFQYTI